MQQKLLKEYIKTILKEENSRSQRQKPTAGDLKKLFFVLSIDDKSLKKKFNNKTLNKIMQGAAKVMLSASGVGLAIEAGVEAADFFGSTDKFKDLKNKFCKHFKISSEDSIEKKLAKMYGVNKKPSLNMISLPQELSILIDDKVEEAFIMYLKEKYMEVSIDSKEPVDIKEEFIKFTKEYEPTKGAYAAME